MRSNGSSPAPGDISTGATSDLEKVNGIARRMVTEFGMSRLGRIYIPEAQASQFLGVAMRDGEGSRSEETAREVDIEVRRIVDLATNEVRELLRGRRETLEALAQRLVDKEVIEGVELDQLLADLRHIVGAGRGTLPSGNGENHV